MKSNLLLGACLGVALALPGAAFASTNGQSANESANSDGQQSMNSRAQADNQTNAPRLTTQQIAQRLEQSLQRAGFTNVQIVPRSFLVRARDQDGNPVIMEVNPRSMTSITALNVAPGDRSSGNVAGNNESNRGGEMGGSPQATNNESMANRDNGSMAARGGEAMANRGSGSSSGFAANNPNNTNRPYNNGQTGSR